MLSYSLLLFGLFYEAICFMSYLVSFCSCVFSVLFSIAITSLWEERAKQCFSYVRSIYACLDLSVSSSS